MTGFGKNQVELTNKLVTIEVKCLNSKQLDLNLRLPNLFRDKEPDLRSLVQQRLERGKVDLTVIIENRNEEASFTLNKPVVLSYYQQLQDLVRELPGEAGTDLLPILIRMPDVLKSEKEDPDEEEWTLLFEAITGAIDKADQFRLQEGGILEADIRQRILRIIDLLEGVAQYEDGRIISMRKKITSQIAELLGNVEFDKNRFEQEMIYYLEKLDITEEKVRLKKHCEYFLETLKEDESNGKKMGFITQEVGREINTLGSKANEVNIQKIVILMKDELEKIKEQLNNIL
jgi:uncharacterized protein (TIGR00255 family)